MFGNQYSGAKVLVTGHTGFKGSWLCEWLLKLGAEVVGASLEPPTDPSLYVQLGLSERLNGDHRLDVRDRDEVTQLIESVQADFVFHLAAQPLVRESYNSPVETMMTNVMGTAHVIDAVRKLDRECAVVVVTTDKVYQNREWLYGYREVDPLGGYDPYSSSKAAAELVVQSWRQSFFNSDQCKVSLATARAGNVIGGGDWAIDRIVPDCVRALKKGEPVSIRNRFATRPWQHVLEPLSGYLWLAAAMKNTNLVSRHENIEEELCGAFNFGPSAESNQAVGNLVGEILKNWSGESIDTTDPGAPHEAGLLNLSIDKAWRLLSWIPIWSFERTIEETVSWYMNENGEDQSVEIPEMTCKQIDDYVACAAKRELLWTS